MKFQYSIAPREAPCWCITSTTDGFTYKFVFSVYRIHKNGVSMLGAMIGRLIFTFAWADSPDHGRRVRSAEDQGNHQRKGRR